MYQNRILQTCVLHLPHVLARLIYHHPMPICQSSVIFAQRPSSFLVPTHPRTTRLCPRCSRRSDGIWDVGVSWAQRTTFLVSVAFLDRKGHTGLHGWSLTRPPHCRDAEDVGAEEELDTEREGKENASAVASNNEMSEDKALAKGFLPTGRVVSILRSGRREYCGVLNVPQGSVPGTHKLLFFPQSKKIPRVRVSTRQAETLRNKRLVVVIDDWKEDSNYPDGHYTQVLGEV